jgi:hypothetical protein
MTVDQAKGCVPGSNEADFCPEGFVYLMDVQHSIELQDAFKLGYTSARVLCEHQSFDMKGCPTGRYPIIVTEDEYESMKKTSH